MSQCNSRDGSTNRAASPRDNDGFRVPSAVNKSAALNSSNQVCLELIDSVNQNICAERG